MGFQAAFFRSLINALQCNVIKSCNFIVLRQPETCKTLFSGCPIFLALMQPENRFKAFQAAF